MTLSTTCKLTPNRVQQYGNEDWGMENLFHVQSGSTRRADLMDNSYIDQLMQYQPRSVEELARWRLKKRDHSTSGEAK